MGRGVGGARFSALRGLPPARTIAQPMPAQRDSLNRDEAVIVAATERAVPMLTAARDLVDRLHQTLRNGAKDALPAWITEASTGMLASLGRGIAADYTAVAPALSEPWSNGQTEGQITKPKLLRRQMYGHGSLDLLRARLLGAAKLTLHEN